MAVDSLELVWAAMGSAADVQDLGDGLRRVELLHKSVTFAPMLWGDSHFDTAFRHAWIQSSWPGQRVRVLKKQVGFEVQPKRRTLARTFGWWKRFRRLLKDYERTIESSVGFIPPRVESLPVSGRVPKCLEMADS